MCSRFFIILFIISFTNSIKIRVTYTPEAPKTVPNELYQEILNTVYLDARATTTLPEPQYVMNLEEITYRQQLNEKELESFYNFRNLMFVSIINNGQKHTPNFRNLPKLRKVQIKQTQISKIGSNMISNTPVEVLDLQQNEISEIEKGAFGKKVHSLDLKCNKLTTIQPTWFRNASNIEWLNFESNQISILQENVFKKFKKLSELYLARNIISELAPGSLSGPSFLHVLDLGTNDISVLNADIFPTENLLIDNLRISFNRLSFLRKDLMERISVNNNSFIYGNPWQCPCVKSIRDWLPATNVKYILPDEASCIFTKENAEQCEYNENLNNELYNTFITSYDTVDYRICSSERHQIDEEKRKSIVTPNWPFGEIDLR